MAIISYPALFDDYYPCSPAPTWLHLITTILSYQHQPGLAQLIPAIFTLTTATNFNPSVLNHYHLHSTISYLLSLNLHRPASFARQPPAPTPLRSISTIYTCELLPSFTPGPQSMHVRSCLYLLDPPNCCSPAPVNHHQFTNSHICLVIDWQPVPSFAHSPPSLLAHFTQLLPASFTWSSAASSYSASLIWPIYTCQLPPSFAKSLQSIVASSYLHLLNHHHCCSPAPE